MNPEVAQKNAKILAQVESYGGGYVWEREIFAVTLMDVAVADSEAAILRPYWSPADRSERVPLGPPDTPGDCGHTRFAITGGIGPHPCGRAAVVA